MKTRLKVPVPDVVVASFCWRGSFPFPVFAVFGEVSFAVSTVGTEPETCGRNSCRCCVTAGKVITCYCLRGKVSEVK